MDVLVGNTLVSWFGTGGFGVRKWAKMCVNVANIDVLLETHAPLAKGYFLLALYTTITLCV